jgi:mannose-6-phosphate isomerase-like protein (cupin superfamily)
MKLIFGLIAASFTTAAFAQVPQATCQKCSASYIPKAELDAYAERGKAKGIIDQQVRALDVGKAHADVGMVYRGKLSPDRMNAAEHHFVSEVYYIIDGEATLETGWDIVNYKARDAANNAVANLNGPGGDGTGIRNPQVHQLKAGDSLIIPAGVGHRFTKIDDHIRYLMVRVDPDKVTPLKTEADSKKDLGQ